MTKPAYPAVDFPSIAAPKSFYDLPEYPAAPMSRAGVADFDTLPAKAYRSNFNIKKRETI